MLKHSSPLDTFRFSKSTDVLHVYFTVLYDSHSIQPQATGSCTLQHISPFHGMIRKTSRLVSLCHWTAQTNCREVRSQNGQLQPRLQLGSFSAPSSQKWTLTFWLTPLTSKSEQQNKNPNSKPKTKPGDNKLMITGFLHFRSCLLRPESQLNVSHI